MGRVLNRFDRAVKSDLFRLNNIIDEEKLEKLIILLTGDELRTFISSISYLPSNDDDALDVIQQDTYTEI